MVIMTNDHRYIILIVPTNQVTAHNHAGSRSAAYQFSTLTPLGSPARSQFTIHMSLSSLSPRVLTSPCPRFPMSSCPHAATSWCPHTGRGVVLRMCSLAWAWGIFVENSQWERLMILTLQQMFEVLKVQLWLLSNRQIDHYRHVTSSRKTSMSIIVKPQGFSINRCLRSLPVPCLPRGLLLHQEEWVFFLFLNK